MTNKYLKPMLDPGSPRVFNCNEMTRKIQTANPGAKTFFRSKPLNTVVLIKDTVPEPERRANMPPVGTKIYFPFNEENIYEGGRTIFLHNQHLEPSIMDHYGEGALTREELDADMSILSILGKLPSLDPFLMKDVFLREEIQIDPAYFEVSKEAWDKIELFMLQRFRPLIEAAFPDVKASDEKTRILIDKIWEARDLDALQPLINAFRLPQNEALNIFSSWRGIVYYSFQYHAEQAHFVELIKWLKDNEAPVSGVPIAESKEMIGMLTAVRDQMRREWQLIETHVRAYQDSYDKMFKYKVSSSEFLTFLKNSNKTYWDLGNSLGKTNHAIFCWDVMSSRFKGRKLPWAQLQEIMHLLVRIFQLDEKKAPSSVVW
jgi:hypothetical protein